MQRLSVASRTRNDITYASSSRKGLQNISPISSLVHQKQAVFRRSYGVLVQCAGAGTALSPTYNMSKNSTPVRMIHAGQRVARRNREPSCSRSSAAWMNSVAARRSISATSSTSQSFVNSASTSTLENNCTNPRIIHLMMASMLAAVTTVGWAFNWYDNSSSSTAATPTSETSSNFSFSSRRTGSAASNSSVPGGIPNKTTKRPYDVSIIEVHQPFYYYRLVDYCLRNLLTVNYVFADFYPRHSWRAIYNGGRVFCGQWWTLCCRF